MEENEVASGEDRSRENPKTESAGETANEQTQPAIQASAADAAQNGQAPNALSLENVRAQFAAEQERIEAVRKICGTEHTKIAALAIREGWDVTRCELEVLRASRPKAPAAHVPDNSVNATVLEAACMLTARFDGVE